MGLKEPNRVGHSRPIRLERLSVTIRHKPIPFLLPLTLLSLATFQSGCVGITSRNSAPAIVSQPTTSNSVNAPLGSTAVRVMFNAPTYGFNVLAGSARTINVRITNGTTFGSAAGTCTINGSMGSYSVTSTATVTITATSVDDRTKSASTVVNVCSTAVQIAVVPFYRTLYVGQKADLQSFIVGSTNLNVTWSMSCTGTAVGILSDTTNRDTVFSGTGSGRCTLTATSNADSTKSATATMYVTGNALPSHAVTPNLTTPVDCTVDPAETGAVYEVGPARAYKTIQSVPTNTMAAGSTVRIHNDDMTGMNPTTYREYFQIASVNGTASQPLRIVGCPDSLGNLPIVDGANATGASWVSIYAAAGYGIATIWKGSTFGYYQSGNPTPGNVIIEGLHLRNAKSNITYTPPSGGAAVAYVAGSSCVNVREGFNTVVLGNDLDNCGNGTFSDANLNSNAWAGNVLWADWEGNHIHSSGESGSFLEHQLYIQGWGQLVQFNRIDNYSSGANGSNLKTRGIGDVIRYNYIGDGAARQVDMIDLEDSSGYETFEGYLGAIGATNCNTSNWCLGDTMGPNTLAAWQEAYHQHFFYGNVSYNSTAEYSFHFAEDHDSGMADRLGTLYFYSNTWNMPGPIGFSGGTIQVLFDTSGGGGNAFNNFEWPQIQAANNIVWTSPSPGGHPYWNLLATQITTFTTNLLASNWGSIGTPINGGTPSAETGNGWSNGTTQFSYPLAVPLNTHMSGLSPNNFLTTGTQPFDSTTYVPPSGSAAIGAGIALTGAMAVMPVRFEYHPDTSTVSTRVSPDTIGALD
jgi:hypothetical protein